MILSHNPERDINGIVAGRYGRKWIVRRILKGLPAQIAFAILAFLLYIVMKWMGAQGMRTLAIIIFILLSFASIIRRIKDGKKEYVRAKIEWLKTLQKEFIQERERLNYGKLASLPWDQHIDKCQQMISVLEAKLGITK